MSNQDKIKQEQITDKDSVKTESKPKGKRNGKGSRGAEQFRSNASDMYGVKIDHAATLFHGTARTRDLVIAKLNQGHTAGLCVPPRSASVSIFDESHSKKVLPNVTIDSRILNPHFLVALGGPNGEPYAAEAFTRMYNAMVGTAYTTTSFGRADLHKHTIISEGLLMCLDMIDRALDLYALESPINKGVSFLRASTLLIGTGDFAKCVAARNELVPYFNKLLVPDSIPALNRHRAFCRNVFADDVHSKTQFIVPLPERVYTRIDSNGSVIVDPNWGTSFSTPLSNFINAVLTSITTYINSSFYADISPYLYRSMLDPNGPHIAKPYIVDLYDAFTPKLGLKAVYDVEAIQLFRNADYVGDLYNMRAKGSLDIVEDNDEILRQGVVNYTGSLLTDGLFVVPLAAKSVTNLDLNNITVQDAYAELNMVAVYPGISEDRFIINMTDFPSPEDANYVCLNGRVVIQDLNNFRNMVKITACGDTLFLYLSIWHNDPLQLPFNEQRFTTTRKVLPYNIVYFYSGWAYYNKQDGVNDNTNDSNALSYYLKTSEIKAFVACPTIINVAYSDGSTSNPTYQFADYGDIDNLVVVSVETLRQFGHFNMYDNYTIF